MLMLKSRELRTQRAKLIEDSRKLLNGELTAEIRAQVEKMDKDIDQLEKDIEAYEKQEKRDRELAASTADPVIDPANEPTDEQRKKLTEKAAREYRDAFFVYMREGETGLSPEQRATLKKGYRQVDEKKESRAQTITTTGGGYLIPQGFQAELERAQKLYGGMLDIARQITTSGGNPLPWPTVDDTGNSGEDSTINVNASTQDVVFGQAQLNAYKMDSGLVLVPNELFEDEGIDLEAELGSILGERLGRRRNNKYTLGSGSSTYQGVTVGASAGITFTSASAILADELFDIEAKVDPAYRKSPKCAWQFRDATRTLLRKLKDADGRYLWQASLEAAAPSTLLNYPVIINQDMPAVATTNKSVVFGDHSKFIIRNVRGVIIRRLNELFAQADQVGFLAFYRGDSRVVSASAAALVYNTHP